MRFFTAYASSSGQRIHKHKSGFLVAPSATAARMNTLKHVTGIQVQNLPIRYLGVPLDYGRCKISYLDDIIRRVQGRIAGWQGRFLSFWGRIILIKHVLFSLPIHLLAASSPPKAVIRRLESIFSRFFLGTNDGRNKHHLLSWSSLCKPFKEGGVAFRLWSLFDI